MTIRTFLIALPLVFVGWLATLVSISLVSDDAPGQVVLLPSDAFLSALPESASIIGMNSWSVTLKSPKAGLARRLYAQGAWIVLPAGLPGCLPMPGQP